MKNLATLIRETEKMFHLPEGAITIEDRAQPLVSFRRLAMIVAKEAGHDPSRISRYFRRDRTTVQHHLRIARDQLDRHSAWWIEAKADLVDRWEEAEEKSSN